MATVVERPRLEPHVATLLAQLRARIRRYVVVEGIAATIATLCAAFWLCLIVDWLFEASLSVRRGLLAVGVAATAIAFYQLIVRRLAVPLSDRAWRCFCRRFRAFDDSLLTAVDWTTSDRDLGDLARDARQHAGRGRPTGAARPARRNLSPRTAEPGSRRCRAAGPVVVTVFARRPGDALVRYRAVDGTDG